MLRALPRPYAVADMRWCRKTGCSRPAAASCSFNYPSSHVWITPLLVDPDPGSYDLCEDHASRLVAPVGWELEDLRSAATGASDSGAA